LKNLSDLFALYTIEREIGEFLEDGYLNPSQAKWVREMEKSLLQKIRPDAVALVDSFNFSDHLLGSALGRYDGQVYQALYENTLRDVLLFFSFHSFLPFSLSPFSLSLSFLNQTI